MSSFQKQVLRWFPNVKNAIADLQHEYLQKKEDNTQTSLKRFGPFLCTLSPEKLAVITAHEALLTCLLKPSDRGQYGTPFVMLAHRIGEAVEQEVLVHRLLHKRAMEQRQWNKKRTKINLSGEEAETDGDDENEKDDVDVDENSTSDQTSLAEDGLENVLDGTDSAFGIDQFEVDGAPVNWTYASSHLKTYLEQLSKNDMSLKKRRVIRYAIRKAKATFDKHQWSSQDRVGLGVALFHCLMENANIAVHGRDEPAFTHQTRYVTRNRQKTAVVLNQYLYDRMVNDKIPGLSAMTTRYKPMIVPPKPWTSPDEGGYLWLQSELMRYHGSHMQKDALGVADMSTLYQGLNVLGQVPWKINQRILEVAWQCWDQNISLGDIPSRTDFDVPEEPTPPPFAPAGVDRDSPEGREIAQQRKSYLDALNKYKRIRQRNMDLVSLRCSAMLKLDQADKFKDFDEIYFPYVSGRKQFEIRFRNFSRNALF